MRILLVEDNELQGELLREMFLYNPANMVTLATSGEHALMILNDSVFDLILSDVNLPVMSGHNLVKLIKRNGPYKDIPFFLYSSRPADPDEIQLALRHGANKYIRETNVQGIYEEVNAYLKSET